MLKKVKFIGKLILLSFIFFTIARTSLLFTSIHSNISIIGLSGGISLGIILLLGYRYLPAIAFGVFFTHFFTDAPIGFVIMISTVNTLVTFLVSYFVKNHFKINLEFSNSYDVYKFLLIGMILFPFLTSILGFLSLYANRMVLENNILEIISFWWLGNAVGLLSIGTLILSWNKNDFKKPTRSQILEGIYLFSLFGITQIFIYFDYFSIFISKPILWSIFPFIIWASLRFPLNISILIPCFSIFSALKLLEDQSNANETLRNLIFIYGFLLISFINTILLTVLRKEQIKKETLLKQKSDLLSRVSKISKIGGWEIDVKTLKQSWTDEVFHIHEINIGTPLSIEEAFQYYQPEARELIQNAYNKAIMEGIPYNLDLQFVTSKGNQLWINTQCNVIKENEKVIRLEGTFQDITEQKLSRENLQLSKEQLQFALHGANLGLWDWNFNTGEVYVNERWNSMLGLPESNINQNIKTWESRVHPEDTSILEYIVKNTILNPNGKFFEAEIRAMHRDGYYIWILDKGAVVERDKEGNPIRIVGTHMDITERKKAEEIIHIKEMSLDAISQGVILADLNRKILYSNKAFQDITGYTEEYLLGKTCTIIQGKETNRETLKYIREAIKNRTPIQTEILNYKKDGSKFWNQLSISPVYDTHGKVIQFVGVQKDITKEKQAELELKHTNEKLESANLAKTEFITNMSHELRTPLNAVIGFSDLLMKADLNNTQKHYMRIVFRSAKNLLDLLNDILDFSKIDSGNFNLNIERIDLFELIHQTTEILNLSIIEKRLKLDISLPENLPNYIFSDPIRLRQILFNLLNNAIKFTEKGKINFKVEILEIDKIKQEGRFRFSIVDTGIGIANQDQERIFAAFSQVDNSTSKKYGGAGLGLSIAQKLLNLLNSTIKIKSELGKGSTFYFELVLKFENKKEEISVIDEELSEIHENIDNKAKDIIDTNQKYRILTVDDDTINIFLLRTLIQDILPNSIILEAMNGKEAVDHCKKEMPDFIFMDIQMPIMNGFEATQEIRNIENGKKIPIVAVTAGIQGSNKEKCIECGMNDFSSKPIVKNTIEMLIKKWLKIET